MGHNLTLCQISVSRSLQALKTGEIVYKSTKTAKGRRIVSIAPRTALMLREYKDTRQISLGKPFSDDSLVFCHVDGKPLFPNMVTHAWIKLVRKCGLGNIRLHDARHTHASLLLKQNIHPKVVQERLGHSSIGIMLDLYSHVAPGMQQAAAKSFEDMVNLESKNGDVKTER